MTSSAQDSFSVIHLIAQADLVVKFVLGILITSSIMSWSIIFDKIKRMRPLSQETKTAIAALRGQCDVRDLPVQSVLAQMLNASQRSLPTKRLEYLLASLRGKAYSDLSQDMGKLASIGSSAVFVGLFGTIWGIMNSFRSIASSQSTNISVVAPGISEALFVTAVGLFVAIPAMVAYNYIMDRINRFADFLERFSQDLMARSSSHE